MRSLRFDFSGIRIRLRGVPDGCRGILEREWSAFVGARDALPQFDLRTRIRDSSGQSGNALEAVALSPAPGGEARFGMPEGSIVVDRTGHGLVDLMPADAATQFCALRNLLLAALAYRLPEQGFLLVHAAAIEIDGSAYVLVGPPGTGKSTWVRLAREAGARSLGEDLVFLQLESTTGYALAAPYRPEESTAQEPGRWPVAALRLARHGSPAGLEPVPRALALGRLVANLPFLPAERRAGPIVGRLVDRLVEALELRCLIFDPSPSFVPVLRDFLR